MSALKTMTRKGLEKLLNCLCVVSAVFDVTSACHGRNKIGFTMHWFNFFLVRVEFNSIYVIALHDLVYGGNK